MNNTGTPPQRRLFVLLGWNPALGAAIDPVGVLGAEATGTGLDTAVSWVPLVHGAAWPWRDRLATTSVTEAVLEAWLVQNGAVQLVEVDPLPAPTLAHLVEGALDRLLIELADEEA